jgi:hypothetical protein
MPARAPVWRPQRGRQALNDGKDDGASALAKARAGDRTPPTLAVARANRVGICSPDAAAASNHHTSLISR